MAWVGSLAFALLMGGCGGSNSSSATVGGSVTGLAAGTSVTLTLQLTGGPSVTMSSNSSFTFSGSLASTNGYNVTVSKQPTGQTCVVNYGSGTIDYAGDSVTDVKVTCTDNVPIGVSVTGLASGNSVVFNLTVQNDPELQLNTSVTSFNVPVTSNGVTYPFPTSAKDSTAVLLPLGTVYSVSVFTQPSGQVCALTQNTTTSTTASTSTTTATTTTTTTGPVTSSIGGVVGLTAIVVDFTCNSN